MIKKDKEKKSTKVQTEPELKKKSVKGNGKPVRKSKTQKLEEEIKSLKTALKDYEDKHLRLKAEFENYRKRKEKEISRILKYEGEEIIKSFLPIADDIERVINSVNGNDNTTLDSVTDGLSLILKKLEKRLTESGVEHFPSIGETFDPELHDALMVRESADHGEKEIIEEFEKGYRYKDKIIRHAKVVVNK